MPIPEKYLADFEEETTYHVYNRTNNGELLFRSEENMRYFLSKYYQHTYHFLDTWCWCLLPNHFHLLVNVKSAVSIKQYLHRQELHQLTITERKFLKDEITLSELIEHVFKRFFQSYALAFNKQHERKGNLFYKPFKRVRVETDGQFLQAAIYIHANSVKHGLTKIISDYKWSSWHSVLSSAPTGLLRNELLDIFGGRELFIKTHNEQTNYYYNVEAAIEN